MQIILKGKKYIREAEHLAGEGENKIEKITWFNLEPYSIWDGKVRYSHDEIFNQELALELETAFEVVLQSELTPQLFFI